MTLEKKYDLVGLAALVIGALIVVSCARALLPTAAAPLASPTNPGTLLVVENIAAPVARPTVGPDVILLAEQLPEATQVCLQLTVDRNDTFDYPEICWPLAQLRDLSAKAERVERLR